ncbi:MAG TPA: hypothetical protein VMV16_09410 [Solirubrobacteraceae bacterium]|nr:hypothetical protein [Solirubrobacteraceae bacterium]
MRRLLACCLCAGLAALAAAPLAPAAHKHTPVHLLIDAQEWSLWPSRSSVPAGPVLVELWNRGQDAHDTWIRRLNAADQMVGPVLGKVAKTLPGKISQATWHLKAGRYELFCSMHGHMALGMHTNLRVTAR